MGFYIAAQTDENPYGPETNITVGTHSVAGQA
jgi:hypothetical protein